MATFVNARHNDLIAGAPPVSFHGTPPVSTTRPQTQPATGLRHEPGDAPDVQWVGTPPFVPPPPRGPFGLAIAERLEPATAPWAFSGKTPPFVPPNPRNNGYEAFGLQQPHEPIAPWSFTRSVVPQIILNLPSRGTAVFATSQAREDWSTPYSYTQAIVGIPTTTVTGVPPFKATFHKANGWWDLLAGAPDVFVAGFATIPPRGPFGFAKGERLEPGDAAYTFTHTQPQVIINLGAPSRGTAFGFQQPDATAPDVLVGGVGIIPVGPPVTARAFGLQLPADVAPFSFTVGRAQTTAIRPLIGAFGAIQSADTAPFVLTVSRAPLVVVNQPLAIRRALGEQQPDSVAPFTFTNNFLAGVSVVNRTRPTQVFALQLPGDAAPYTFARSVPFQIITPTSLPFGGQWDFVTDTVDYNSPFSFTRGLFLASTTPAATAMILSEAIFRVVNANLEVFVIPVHSDTIPPGYVVSQSPAAGLTVPEWSVVTIYVSDGPAYPFGTEVVPNCVGLTAHHARNLIFAARLSLDFYAWVSSSATAGTVVAQTPAATSVVVAGTLVKLTLSRGAGIPAPTTVVPIAS